MRPHRRCFAFIVAIAAAFGPPLAWSKPAPDSFSAVVKTLSPSVVNISTATGPDRPDSGSVDDAPRANPFGKDAASGATSLGSGFIVDPTGFIVTNHHVINDAQSISVTLADGRRLDARVVGVDRRTDLALLKVSAPGPLPFVSFGDSDKAEVGDWVIVIGNPYGLGGSVSAGIVSARNRELKMGAYDDFIQTDAAINSGNSGGPLFNLNGEVIGVNSALLSPSGGSVGIGFAVSANLARPVVAQLRSFGEVRRGWIGVRVQTVTPDIADSLALGAARGALVNAVTRGGPGERAGLRAGDVILKFDGKDISDMRAFPRIVAESPIGKSVKADILRRGGAQSLAVQIGRLPDDGPTRKAAVSAVTPAGQAQMGGFGMVLSGVTAELRQRFGVPRGVDGVVVMAVTPGTPASDTEIQPGDVIVGANQAPIRTMEEFRAVSDGQIAQKKKFIFLALSRRGETMFKALATPVR